MVPPGNTPKDAMDRLACVNIPFFALQIAYRKHPQWKDHPTAILSEQSPKGVVLEVNDLARHAHITPGSRYGQALSLCGDLRATCISQEVLHRQSLDLLHWLKRFSPQIEIHDHPYGVFWINAKGLAPLFKTPARWARAIHKKLKQHDLDCRVVVGFSRFGSFITSTHVKAPITIYKSAQDEMRDAYKVPLDRLPIAPKAYLQCQKLGLANIGEWLHLPPADILAIHGADAFKVYQLATQSLWDPLRPTHVEAPVVETVIFDHAILNTDRLLFALRRPLEHLITPLIQKHRAIQMLFIGLRLDGHAPKTEAIRPAEPSLDPRLLLRLCHLRLSNTDFAAGVLEVHLSCKTTLASDKQLMLFKKETSRSHLNANRGLARLRAEMGNHVVQKAKLKEAHLPEAGFKWHPMPHLEPALPRPMPSPRLVRRIFSRPRVFRVPSESLSAIAECLPGGIVQSQGPYDISGGWWGAKAVQRRYYYITTAYGKCLWIYFDAVRRCWVLQGIVT